MSAFYDRMAATALRLIEQFGQTITLVDTAEGEYDPATGMVSPGSVTEQPAQAILQDYSATDAGKSYAAGTVIQQGDKKILIAAQGIAAPQLSTQIIASGATWAAVSIKEINPAGVPLVYEVQGRK